MATSILNGIRERLANRPDEEHKQVMVRLAIVSAATVYLFSDWFASNSGNPEYVRMARWTVLFCATVAIGIGLSMLLRPDVSVARRIFGMFHDVFAISAAMYLGEGGAAGAAAIYLWITLGNGFRYGNAYLYSCALLSFVCFATVFWLSDYWREQATLSANILILLALVPPYVGALLSSLRKAKDQLKHQASVDMLTGLLNRAETEMAVERVLDMQQDGHALLFCDLDLFKQVNDNAGHAAGDKLLTDVAHIIAECAGKSGLTGRLGGDEFCVFLLDCSMERARQVAENIRNSVSGYRLAWGRDYFSVGISIGVAPTSAVKDMGSLFRLADAACYAAKNAGRNQVHMVDSRTGEADTKRIRKLFADSPLGDATGRNKRHG